LGNSKGTEQVKRCVGKQQERGYFSFLITINMVKKILIGLLMVIAIIQLLQPNRNIAEGNFRK